MTAFSPTTTTLDPPGQTDELAGAVLASLSRPIGRQQPWGPVTTAILSVLTIGLLPLLSWPARLRNACLREQQQLWHLAEWLRLNSGRPDALSLQDSTRRLAFRPGLHMAALLIVFLGIFSPLRMMPPHPHWTLAVIFQSMYSKTPLVSGQLRIGNGVVDPFLVSFAKTWSVVLTAAFFLHWLQLQLHIGDMRMFVTRFNAITSAHGLKPVRMPHTGIGLRPIWLLVGIAGLALGVKWALPLMIVGAVQNRYLARTTYIVRQEMAQRMSLLAGLQNPAAAVATPMRLWSCCSNPQCGAIIPPAAKFCPRCGVAAAGRV
jgi:hypothetical protein